MQIETFANPASCAPCDSIYSRYLEKSFISSSVGRKTIILGIEVEPNSTDFILKDIHNKNQKHWTIELASTSDDEIGN